MSLDSFQDRVNRITSRTASSPAQLAIGEGGVAVPKFSSPVSRHNTGPRTSRSFTVTAILFGILMGVVVAGLATKSIIWGPLSGLCCDLEAPATIALLLSPFVAILGCTVQRYAPSLFYATSAYLPAAILATYAY